MTTLDTRSPAVTNSQEKQQDPNTLEGNSLPARDEKLIAGLQNVTAAVIATELNEHFGRYGEVATVRDAFSRNRTRDAVDVVNTVTTPFKGEINPLTQTIVGVIKLDTTAVDPATAASVVKNTFGLDSAIVNRGADTYLVPYKDRF